MDDVIISSPSFTQHIEHLKEVFRLLQDAGLTLNKNKCKFICDELKYLGLIINKEGIKTDETKVRVVVKMKLPRNSKEVSKFLDQHVVLGLRQVEGLKELKKENIGYKRSRESGLVGPEKRIRKGSDHRVPKRALSSNYTTNSNLPKFRKKSRREETVAATTSDHEVEEE
ncbi:hypothetical protein TNCV_2215631 [Trichonephila clavipes]|nr:hypothetical protein TNCV_2215631 [Trichonephila clavipes]